MTDRDTDLDELVQRARSGDAAAMEDLMAALRPRVLRRCHKFLPYTGDAEEACQDALVAIATKLDSYDGHGSFLGWVTVIASNCARSTYRSLKRRHGEHPTEIVPEQIDPRTTSVIAGSRLDLLEALDALEDAHPAVVEAFMLRDLGSLPYDDIAERAGVPVGTVKAQVHRARAFMRERLIATLS